jgi:hypothetical protein
VYTGKARSITKARKADESSIRLDEPLKPLNMEDTRRIHRTYIADMASVGELEL